MTSIKLYWSPAYEDTPVQPRLDGLTKEAASSQSNKFTLKITLNSLRQKVNNSFNISHTTFSLTTRPHLVAVFIICFVLK
ncbi:hypothetical protein CROQUDRAFT_663187 [Cronartium quercuum f. sp. fusiforme G11]|uniref:Uncharacterized protein n=1 Tax=Cronartium quercuum f. sp. fusiforme G11 TaxID=708437 RepID=A0A9P6T7D8_9BASI|nr:hypothetical protein CROQUDRAFT_663187 [Cronartium quercuum f. sp. fusiforme G11]